MKKSNFKHVGELANENLSSKPSALPADMSPREDEQFATSLDCGNETQTRILLVEDNWDHAYLASKTLSATGRYRVDLATSGSEALYKLATEKFSLLLVDYNLTGMNGLDLMQKIRAENYDVPIVMITGLGSEHVAVKAMKAGAYDYVVKSGDYLSTLSLIIENTLERHELKKIKQQWEHWILKRNRELEALNAIGLEISKSLRLDEVIKLALEKTIQILELDYGKIHMLKTGEAATQAFGPTQSTSQVDETGLPREVIERVAQERDSIIIEDTSDLAEWTCRDRPNNLRSAAYVPLKFKEKILGILVLASRRKSHFTVQDKMLLSAIGSEIGAALENVKLYEEIRRQADKIREDAIEQKRLEEQLIQSEKLAGIGQFVAGIAHELNNPLASVTGFTQILLKEEGLALEVRYLLQKIYDEVKRATQIIRNLLSFARERKTEKTYVDINDLLSKTLSLRTHKLKTDNIQLVTELKPKLPWAFVDPLQLQLVFLNIIINAEQAMSQAHGGGKLEIKTRVRNKNTSEALNQAGSVEVLFSDNGPGIKEENLHRIFDPFFTTKGQEEGTGLGLSIAYGIVKEHGGEIFAESEEGKGTSFIISLPNAQIQSASR